MVYVDVHAHLDYDSFDEDREELLKKLSFENIEVLSNTLNFEGYKNSLNLFKNYKNIKVCPGLYPSEAEKISDKDFDEYLNYLKKNKKNFIAIGEIGLDKYHTDDEFLFNKQIKRFRQFCDLAIELDKALIIHTRKAEKEVLEIIREYVEKKNFRKFNLHCFMGKKKFIKDIKELNIYCSIPLIILNTQSFEILVEGLNINQILVETDSPFLNPNKEKNTPLNVPLIYEKIAKIKKLDKKEIENIIYMNYRRLIM